MAREEGVRPASAPTFPDERLLKAGSNLVVDRVTLDLLHRFGAEHLGCILLKGPSIAHWLYTNPADRTYVDTDLLLAEDDFDQAQRILSSTGFTPFYSELPLDRPWYARSWLRATDGAMVELHRTLPGVSIDPRSCWQELSSSATCLTLHGEAVDVLSLEARTMHVALHAAHDGDDATHSRVDLERASAELPIALWREAADLALRLDAMPAFTFGMSMTSASREIARSIDGPVQINSAVPVSSSVSAIQWFFGLKGTRARVRFLIAKLFPPADFLRLWHPSATRGALGLLAVRLWRPMWVVGRGLRGLLGFLRTRPR